MRRTHLRVENVLWGGEDKPCADLKGEVTVLWTARPSHLLTEAADHQQEEDRDSSFAQPHGSLIVWEAGSPLGTKVLSSGHRHVAQRTPQPVVGPKEY